MSIHHPSLTRHSHCTPNLGMVQMNAYNHALCVALRKHSKPKLTYDKIAKIVVKKDGTYIVFFDDDMV